MARPQIWHQNAPKHIWHGHVYRRCGLKICFTWGARSYEPAEIECVNQNNIFMRTVRKSFANWLVLRWQTKFRHTSDCVCKYFGPNRRLFCPNHLRVHISGYMVCICYSAMVYFSRKMRRISRIPVCIVFSFIFTWC